MSILLDSSTRVIVQGITGREGLYHTRNMKTTGTNIVGGMTPGKGGTTAEGVPVFDTVAEAKAATDAEASCIFVPPAGAADAIMEAASASISLIVCITEGIPVIDMTQAMAKSVLSPTRYSNRVPSVSSHAPARSHTRLSPCSLKQALANLPALVLAVTPLLARHSPITWNSSSPTRIPKPLSCVARSVEATRKTRQSSSKR